MDDDSRLIRRDAIMFPVAKDHWPEIEKSVRKVVADTDDPEKAAEFIMRHLREALPVDKPLAVGLTFLEPNYTTEEVIKLFRAVCDDLNRQLGKIILKMGGGIACLALSLYEAESELERLRRGPRPGPGPNTVQ